MDKRVVRALLVRCPAFLILISLSQFAWAGGNLIKDASFEGRLPLWFEVHGRGWYHADKTITDSAADGKTVMTVKGWPVTGCLILSPVIKPSPVVRETRDANNNGGDAPKAVADKAALYSFTAKLRGFGADVGPSVEFLFFNTDKRPKKLLSLGEVALSGKGEWSVFEKKNIAFQPPKDGFKLGIRLKGPKGGSVADRHVEFDQIGLFNKAVPETVTDNSDVVVVEAEDMADGVAWKIKAHYGGWYSGIPSGMKMLMGSQAVKKSVGCAVSKKIKVKTTGAHRLWWRYLTSHYKAEYTITLKQNGAIVAEKVCDGVLEGRYRWVWDSMDVELSRGMAELVLSRPANGASWITRKLDVFVLTNDLDYKPKVADFRPDGYMRFTNLSDEQAPFCLWIWVRRHRSPYYANPGMLTMAGNSRGYLVPGDKSLWLSKGDTSPWVRISDDLLVNKGLNNNVSLTATRKGHTAGFVEGRIKGKLEFAVGRDKKIVKTINVDQDAPKIILNLPADFEADTDKIRDAWAFIKKKQEVLRTIESAGKKRAKHLNILTNLSLNAASCDSKIILAEMDILAKLGFNGIYRPAAAPDKVLEFYDKVGMKRVFGLGAFSAWRKGGQPDPWHPNLKAADYILKKVAERYEPILKYVDKVKLYDEPGVMSFKKIATSQKCVDKFRELLKERGFTPKRLGVSSWDEVVPVLPEDSVKHPELYYHSAMFRLEANANLARALTAVKSKYMKTGARTYVNYVPNWSGSNYVQRGCDPFLMQRNNGLEMLWSEDWLGYGASVEHVSTAYAFLRSAGAPTNQPLGTYVVVKDARNPISLRMKIYTALAGGATTLEFYSYGPAYAGIDSWSMRYNLYPELSKVLHELARIDDALRDAKRPPAEIAILYNRTASIWEKKLYVSEQNAQYTHWALAHAGYDADFIPEEDVAVGKLDKYKVLYIDGVNMRRDAAEKIAEWVRGGGVLFGSAAVGTKDEYDKPMSILNEVFGVAESKLQPLDMKIRKSAKRSLMQDVNRPKYELRGLKSQGEVSTLDGLDIPKTRFQRLCLREALIPSDKGKMILENKKNECAGVMNSFGAGKAIRVAGFPGIAYLHGAITAKKYDINSYLPRKFSRELRDFITWPAKLAKAARIAETSEPIAEIVRYDGKDQTVVFVIDHDAVEKKKFTFTLLNAPGFKSASSATGNHVEIRQGENDSLTVSLPMNAADAIVLKQ